MSSEANRSAVDIAGHSALARCWRRTHRPRLRPVLPADAAAARGVWRRRDR
jgi:hypothetical protein